MAGNSTEFDRYAEEYERALDRGISVSGEDKEFFARGRVEILRRHLDAISERPRAILDYGCGTGSATPFFLELLKPERFLGVDISAKSLEVARREHPQANVSFHLFQDYEPRGELQFVVEGMQRAGVGALFEQFLRLKAQLDAEGLFDTARKRPLPLQPRGIGLVTSAGAAALHDVVTALRRRVPHIPVVLVPAQVQGVAAPPSIIAALSKLYLLAQAGRAQGGDSNANPPIDVILLVRGGGSIEDLWAFNDEQLARTIVQSPVPLVSGVGHETDFTIADFCADLRAPTPTAAAELVAQPREVWLGALDLLAGRLSDGVQRQLDTRHQRLDQAAARLGRPSGLVARQQLQLARLAQRMRHGVLLKMQRLAQRQQALEAQLPQALQRSVAQNAERLERAALRLELLDPRLVLQRGYALLTDTSGQAVTSIRQAQPGDALRATLSDGAVDVTVSQPRLL